MNIVCINSYNRVIEFSLSCTFLILFVPFLPAASARTPSAGKQHRAVSGAGSVGAVIISPAGPEQKSPSHLGILLSQAACKPAGAPSHRYLEQGQHPLEVAADRYTFVLYCIKKRRFCVPSSAENPWRCDCALGWLRTWIRDYGQRLLSSAEQRRLMCSEPPRLSHLSLVEVAPNSLVCIPPVVQLEPSHLTVRLGESLRVSCQASGYPQPQVTWKKASHGKTQLSSQGLVQELGPNGEFFKPGVGGVVTALPSNGGTKAGGSRGIQGRGRGVEEGSERDSFDPDLGSGMLFLSNVTVAHAGRYECEAWNPGGVARVTFHLAVNMSSSSYSSQIWPRLNSHSFISSSSNSFYQPEVLDVNQEPLYEQESMDFSALGPATQTAIAVGISLLALTAVLLLIMIYTRHQQYQKEEGGSYCASKEESILYANDYSDGPTTFSQLEDYRDDQGHEMYVLNRTNPILGSSSSRCAMMGRKGMKEALLEHEMVQTLSRSAGMSLRRNPADGREGPLTAGPEELFLSQSLLFGSQVAYEIHC